MRDVGAVAAADHRDQTKQTSWCCDMNSRGVKRKHGSSGHWSLGLKAAIQDTSLRVDSDERTVTIKDKYPKVRGLTPDACSIIFQLLYTFYFVLDVERNIFNLLALRWSNLAHLLLRWV